MRYWQSQENRRKFCENFARIQGFDPLVPENWYSIFKSTFVSDVSSLFFFKITFNAMWLILIYFFIINQFNRGQDW